MWWFIQGILFWWWRVVWTNWLWTGCHTQRKWMLQVCDAHMPIHLDNTTPPTTSMARESPFLIGDASSVRVLNRDISASKTVAPLSCRDSMFFSSQWIFCMKVVTAENDPNKLRIFARNSKYQFFFGQSCSHLFSKHLKKKKHVS